MLGYGGMTLLLSIPGFVLAFIAAYRIARMHSLANKRLSAQLQGEALQFNRNSNNASGAPQTLSSTPDATKQPTPASIPVSPSNAEPSPSRRPSQRGVLRKRSSLLRSARLQPHIPHIPPNRPHSAPLLSQNVGNGHSTSLSESSARPPVARAAGRSFDITTTMNTLPPPVYSVEEARDSDSSRGASFVTGPTGDPIPRDGFRGTADARSSILQRRWSRTALYQLVVPC